MVPFVRRYSVEILTGVLLTLAVFLVFGRSLRADFVMWDDNVEIYGNKHIQSLNLETVKWAFTENYVSRYKPLTWLALAAINEIQGGPKPFGFHLANLLLASAHAIVLLVLLYRVLHVINNDKRSDTNKRALWLCSATAAFFWVLHPLRVETVAWASSYFHSQALLFLFLSALLYVESNIRAEKRSLLYWGSVVSYIASILSFPTGLGFPIVPLVLDVFVFGRIRYENGTWWNAQTRRALLGKLPFFLIAGLFTLFAVSRRLQGAEILLPTATVNEFGVSSRIAQAFYMWAYYLWRPWFPFDLSPVYTTLVSFKPTEPRFLLSALTVIGGTVVSWTLRKRSPLFLAIWILYLFLLVPMLGLTEHPHFPNDRYGNLPLLCWAALIALGLSKLVTNRLLFLRAIALASVIICAFAGLSILQTPLWQNSVTLFQGILRHLGDNSYRADIYWRLGVAYSESENHPEAANAFTKALLDAPNNSMLHECLATSLVQLEKFSEAREHVLHVIQANPKDVHLQVKMYHLLAEAETKAGKFEAAISHYAEALRVAPDDVSSLIGLGDTLFAAKRLAEGKSQYLQAINLHPKDADLRNRYAINLAMNGDLNGAKEQFTECLRLFPNHANTYQNFGILLQRQGLTNDAQKYFLQAENLRKTQP